LNHANYGEGGSGQGVVTIANRSSIRTLVQIHVLAGQLPAAPVSAQQELVDAAETIAETQGGCGHLLNSLALIRLYNHVEGSRFQEVDPPTIDLRQADDYRRWFRTSLADTGQLT
jgi:hypothetical protein